MLRMKVEGPHYFDSTRAREVKEQYRKIQNKKPHPDFTVKGPAKRSRVMNAKPANGGDVRQGYNILV
jgi:hypothetical protein